MGNGAWRSPPSPALCALLALATCSSDPRPRADGSAPTASIGAKCTTSATCGTGAVCAPDVAGGGYCTAVCTTTGRCPAGSACVEAGTASKICIKTCAPLSACRAEHLCTDGLCLPRCTGDGDCDSGSCDVATGTCGPSRVGDPCGGDLECGPQPAFCDRTRPEGYCSLPCGGSKNAGCPAGTSCSSTGGAGACLRACNGPADCRTGQLCATGRGGVKSCVPQCSADDDCGPGLRCDTRTGACVAGGPASGQLGGACTASSACTGVGPGAVCFTEGDGFPHGYCSISCAATACPAAGTCVEFSSASRGCLSRCALASDCREGYTCLALAANAGRVCIPRCTRDLDCNDPALICDPAGGLCVPRGPGGSVATSDRLVLTPTPIQVATGVASERLVVTVPADAVSVTFAGQAISDPGAKVVVYRMEQSADDFAAATRLFDYGSLANQVRIEDPAYPGAFAALYPNSPLAPFTPSSAGATVKVGIRLAASRPTSATVSAIVKRAPSRVLTQGQLDLNLYFVGLPTLDAARARSDSRFQQILESVKGVWARAGLSVGAVSYLDIAGADGLRFGDLNADDLGALVSRSANPAASDSGLDVFFVNSITGGTRDGYIILGVSAGLPGVPLRGTSGSGLAVTAADFPDGLEGIAHTWAHEGGHWLGLYHTTEASGDSFDPLPDTPECPRAPHDANADQVLQASECAGRGADNLMFWAASPSIVQSTVTANQSFVLLRSPAVH